MARIEKTVFISYRTNNRYGALAVYKDLTHHGFDVFIDYQGIGSGAFESVILEHIRGRAHFLVLLTPSALEHCDKPEDWLRREVEEAIECRRNVIPLMMDGFDFNAPANVSRLTGKLSALKDYNGLRVYAEYFDAAMDRLRSQAFLDKPLESVSHPALLSLPARQAAVAQQAAADAAPAVRQEELTAQGCFERGFNATDFDEKIRYYSEAIRLKPDYAEAYGNRGNARAAKGDHDGAITDYTEVIRLKPDDAFAYYNRGLARRAKGDQDGAIADLSEAIRLKPDDAFAYNNRGLARRAKGDLDGAITDYAQAIRLKPDDAGAYYNRGLAYRSKSDPASVKAAIADFQKYLDLGGIRDGDQAQVEGFIRGLKKKL